MNTRWSVVQGSTSTGGPYLSGTTSTGPSGLPCCLCDINDRDGHPITRVGHALVFYCGGCSHTVCPAHMGSCGLCLGCCIKEHSHPSVHTGAGAGAAWC